MFDRKTILTIIITATVIIALFFLFQYFNVFCRLRNRIVINNKCYKLPNEFYDVYSSLVNYYYINDNKYYQSSRLNSESRQEISKQEYIDKFISSIKKIDERQYS